MMIMLNATLYLVGCLTFGTSYGQADCHCPTVVYLQFGGKDEIPCRCDHFNLVSWYSSKNDYDVGGVPFIKYDNSETRGTGKTSGQFDLELDGSLIINSVSIINHGMEYFCVFLRNTETVKNRVKVEVIVSPDPLYPVLNGHINHQHFYLEMKRQGTLNCSMEGVHPKVNLSITVIDQGQQGGVYLERGDIRHSPYGNNTYNVEVTYNYTADLYVQASIVQCKVTGELGEHLSEVMTAEISFPPAFPAINGGIGPEHIYLEVNRTGEIECSIRSLDSKTSLVWKATDPISESKIIFDDCILSTLPRSDGFIVSLKCSYDVKDGSVDRLTVQCQVTGIIDGQYQKATKVNLLFPKKEPPSPTPVIDGCSGEYDVCTLKVKGEGKLTCRMKNIPQLVELQWNVFDGFQWHYSSGSMEIARDVISTFHYELKKSQEILIAECYSVVGDRIHVASSMVVLVTEGDGESDNKSGDGVLIGLNLLTIFLAIIIIISIVLLRFYRKKDI